MPKGHPISVPRTWPGHRDYEPREVTADELFKGILQHRNWTPEEAALLDAPLRYPDLGQHDDITQEQLNDPVIELRGEAADRAREIHHRRLGGCPYRDCPAAGGTGFLCDDDHCREV